MDYYDIGILYVLGSQIGEVLCIDRDTLNRSKGRFARICVKIDLSKPLLPCIKVNGVEKKIEYEGLHLICFRCGMYGHDLDHCSFANNDTENMIIPDKVVKEQSPLTNGSDAEPYGEWMVVQRRWQAKVQGR